MWSYSQKLSQKNVIIFSKKIQKNIDNIPQKCDHIPTQGEEVDCPSAVQGSKLWVDCWQRGGIFGENHHCFLWWSWLSWLWWWLWRRIVGECPDCCDPHHEHWNPLDGRIGENVKKQVRDLESNQTLIAKPFPELVTSRLVIMMLMVVMIMIKILIMRVRKMILCEMV